jgi:hypothetical protein
VRRTIDVRMRFHRQISAFGLYHAVPKSARPYHKTLRFGD